MEQNLPGTVMESENISFIDLHKPSLTLHLHDFDLVELVEATADMFAPQAHAKGLEFICSIDSQIPSLVTGDPIRLSQVLCNLLANAIKFTSSGSVALTVSDTPRANYYLLTVSDTGEGMAPDKKARIFDDRKQPCVQYDFSPLNSCEMTLPDCKNIIHLMQGTLGVNSAPGDGSIFYFTARLQTAKSAKPSRDIFTPPFTTGQFPRILVADGHPSTLEHLSNTLNDVGADVSTATDGNQAFELYKKALTDRTPYSVLLIDSHLDGLSGVELVERIQQQCGTRPYTILMLTSETRLDRIEISKTVHQAKFITKPIKRTELLRRILEASNSTSCAPSQATKI